MNELSLDEASGLVALLLDGMTCQSELELGEDAVLGLSLALHAVQKTLQRESEARAAACCA